MAKEKAVTPKTFKPTPKDIATAPERIKPILAGLKKLYPDAHCELNYSNPLELFVATVLSAQCTDVRVNMVTPALFKKYRSAADYAKAPAEDLEQDIKSTGFFRNKAKNIQQACGVIERDYGGQLPDNLDELVKLPGVGRKTANVILGDAFGVPGITTDTHVIRLSRLLALSNHADPVKLENNLMELIPQKQWTLFSHRLIWHGRRVCNARKPECDSCELRKYCPYGLAIAQ